MDMSWIQRPPSKNQTDTEGMIESIAINTGLSMSIFLLCVHLIVFAVAEDLRNLSDKNLASFCLALLLEYTCTLISGALESTVCYYNEIAAYYFIMASAFWMLTMSYDIWQMLRSSTTELIVSSGKQCKKFLLYTLWSWLMPALLTLLVFFVLPRVYEDFDLDLQDFDSKKCSFKETDKMYIFMTSVFGPILLLNTFFFVSSVYYISSTRAAVNRVTGSTTLVKHFQLYGKLSLIMGVTWTVEFFIYYAEFDILSFTFKVINTLEGFFIVLAFTSRKEVLQYFKSLHVVKSIQNTQVYHYMSLRRM